MKIGEWVVYTDEGIWSGCFGLGPSFPNKKTAIDVVAAASLDTREMPRVRRLGHGIYMYTPKDCDGHFEDEYFIAKLTADNMARFQKMESNNEDNDSDG